jgi:hypothetical protein
MATWWLCGCAVRSSPQRLPVAVDELATTIRPFGDSSPWDGVGHVAYQPCVFAVTGFPRGGAARPGGCSVEASSCIVRSLAGVAESADASVSNTDERKLVWVQVPPPAPVAVRHPRRYVRDRHGKRER